MSEYTEYGNIITVPRAQAKKGSTQAELMARALAEKAFNETKYESFPDWDGTFDFLKMPKPKLNTSVYGNGSPVPDAEWAKFWQQTSLVSNNGSVVPEEVSVEYYEHLKADDAEYHIPEGYHEKTEQVYRFGWYVQVPNELVPSDAPAPQ